MIQEPDSPPKPILPPRPNPGPEPWPESTESATLWVAVAVLILLGIGLLLLWIRARRKAKKASGDAGAIDPPPSSLDPRIRHAEVVRSALSGRFGPSWAAKTTEEVEMAIRSVPDFDEVVRQRLGRLLREADRLKFDGRPDFQGDDALEWVEPVLAAIAAGASSTSSAK